MKATYSPEDNKIRIYPDYRLDTEEYKQVKAAGFKWAPKQELFVAPMWTPDREDFAIEMCGKIEDEDTSLVERQEERAGRFENYSDKRASEAESAHNHVQSICDGIPFGQPILVGHHSERHARKHAQQIENGMRKAVSLWETSSYWTQRAAGALRLAKYKERPDVRARRIKKIEADKRKVERTKSAAESMTKTYTDPEARAAKLRDGRELLPELLKAWESGLSYDNQRRFEKGELDFETALEMATASKQRTIEWCSRWINHYDNRLSYEKAMLGEQGKLDLIAPKARPKQLPLCNYRAPEGIKIENKWNRGEFSVYPQLEMTKAEYAAIFEDNRGCDTVENSHRVRTIVKRTCGDYSRCAIFLTDSKVHEKPASVIITPYYREPSFSTQIHEAPERTKFDDLKDSLKEGVQTVSAPQLFPTPPDIAEKIVEMAEIEPGHDVLEPSAGTGALLDAVRRAGFGLVQTAVEINYNLCERLKLKDYDDVRQGDFLEQNGNLGTFDRIVMNPPFENGVDIKHIKHALTFLRPGGRLVALCANGPRQERELQPLADHWEVLPAGSFKNQGTGVNVALMVIRK